MPEPLVVPLSRLDYGDAGRAGRKAATLGALLRAGLTVPDGLVLTCAAFQHVAAPADPVELPVAVDAALAEIAMHFAGQTMAVRSSAVAEDLPDASFAGQYDTVLHVRGVDELRTAVRRCWASATGPRVRAYQANQQRTDGSAAAAPMAVLVQQQLAPDVAGVAFTVDPVTGATDQVIVSAVPGLGDAVADGSAEPDEWAVRDGLARPIRVGQQALAADQAVAVAALGRRIEHVLGHACDIEWAMADGRLQVLQARPVTGLPAGGQTPGAGASAAQPPVEQPPVEVPAGTWLKESARHPEPLSVLGASVAGPLVSQGLSDMFARYGGLIDHVETRAIGGEPYLRMVPVGGREGTPPPWWLLTVLARVVPSLRTRMRAARATVRDELFGATITRWYADDRPRLQRQIQRLRAVDLTGQPDVRVAGHLRECLLLLSEAMHLHFELIPAYAVPVYDLIAYCRRALDWSEPDALALLAGTSTATFAPARALADVAAQVRAHGPEATHAVEAACADGADVGTALTDCDPALGAAFAQWCERYAFRCVRNDPASPMLLERPDLLALWLRAAVRGPAGAGAASTDEPVPAATIGSRRAQALARAAAQLSTRPARDKARFDRLLAAAERSYPLREDSAFWTASVPAALIRTAALAAGARLVARGRLDHPDDVVHLPAELLLEALDQSAGDYRFGDQPPDLRARVARAQAERGHVLTHPGPPFYGPPPAAPPDPRGLPGPARRLNAALLWVQREPRPTGVVRRPAGPTTMRLTGVPGSAGVHTGTVRVLRGEADFDRLQPGDVLVCPTTDPAWSVLFGIAGALVTDGGGLLSHAAIVAREHAVPAVLGTGGATRVLADGDLVTVDGTNGTVTAIPAPATAGATSTADRVSASGRLPIEEDS